MSKSARKKAHSRGKKSVYNSFHPSKEVTIGAGFETARVCIEVDQPKKITAWQEWRNEWGTQLTILESSGCGCCVEVYRIAAPPEAIEHLDQLGLLEEEVADQA